MRLLFSCLLLCLFLSPSLCAQDLYEITLKDGKTMNGYLEEIGFERYKINIVFRGKVMGSKEVTAKDIVKKTIVTLPESKIKKDPVIKEAAKEESNANKEAGKEQSAEASGGSVKPIKGKLEEKYRKANIKVNECKQSYENALANLKIHGTNVATTASIQSQIKDAQKTSDAYVQALVDFNSIRKNQFQRMSSSAAKHANAYVDKQVEAIRQNTIAKVLDAESSKEKIRFAHKWFKSADLKAVPESLAKGKDADLKRIQRLNKKLSQLRNIRSGKIDYKAVLTFIDNVDQFTLYIDTH